MEDQKTSPTLPVESLFWADRLRNIATVMVIAIHVAAPVAHVPQDIQSSWWWSGNFWNSLSRPGVPLFVMLSGFLLLGKDYPLMVFLKRRFSRVVIPALFWMVVYSIYNHIANGNPAIIGEALRNIIVSPVHYHLWFIYLIIGLYLVYPVLRPWIKSAGELEYRYFFIMCIIGTWGYKILALFFHLPIGIYFELFTNNCGYFVLGYYLGTKSAIGSAVENERIAPWRFTEKQLIYLGAGLALLGTASTILASYLVNLGFQPGQEFNVYFYDYLTPNVAISAIGWFLLAKTAFNSSPLLDIERDFSAASFGIYFAHVLVMDYCGKLGYWHSMAHPIYVGPFLAAMIYLLTFLAIALIRVLPGGQRVT